MGIDDSCHDAEYAWQDIAPDTPQAIRDALVTSPAAAGAGPVRVVRAGSQVPWPRQGELRLEDDRQIRLTGSLPADLPLGYHDFFPDDQSGQTRLIVTPAQCAVPRGFNGVGQCSSTPRVRPKAGASATWPTCGGWPPGPPASRPTCCWSIPWARPLR